MRSDGRANRERITGVARRLFAEAGDDQVTMARIARKAEVTVTTLYRHFPTRERLVAEACEHHWAAWTNALAAAQQNPAAGDALFQLLRLLCQQQVRHPGSTRALVAALLDGEGVATPQDAQTWRIESLLERARAENSIRADVTLDDLKILLAGNQGVIDSAGPEESDRYVTIMLRSFAHPGRTA